MNKKMTHTARAELANAIRRRYSRPRARQKRKILDEFIASDWLSREVGDPQFLNRQPPAEVPADTQAPRSTTKRPVVP